MTFIWIVLGILGLVVGVFLLGWLSALRASMVRNWRLEKLISPAIRAVEQNDPSAQERVAEFARIAAARNHLFARLKDLGKADIFPACYRSVEKVAESDLACWLMHPNELAAPPSEIELMQDIPIQEDGKTGTFYLFRFRIEPGHWASNRGWMAGVAGPYWDNTDLPDFASGTFSELAPFDRMTLEQHVDFLRAARKKKVLVVPS